MDIPELQMIYLVFGLFLTVTFSKVLADEKIQQSVPCKEGWYFFGEKCYKIFTPKSNTESSWRDSQNSCKLNEGNLASIHSKELQDFLAAFLLLNSKSDAWIGLHDQETELKFSWVDGSIFNYTNWDGEEPPGVFWQDCVLMQYKKFKMATWTQTHCDNPRSYICQANKKEDTKSPDPRFCSIEDGGGWKYMNSCYHIVREETSWEEAEKYCEENYKGNLVTILDDYAEIFLNYVLKLSGESKHVWIGMNLRNDSIQKWTSGWHISSKRFKNMDFENDTCVIKTNLNSWATAPCYNKYPFICEKTKYNLSVQQKPPSDDWECPHSGENWLDFGGEYCYYIETRYRHKRNWFLANFECGRKGGTLASFHSEHETNILHPYVIDINDELLIGIRFHTDSGGFEWADGTNFTYTNWGDGHSKYKEKCSIMSSESMKWYDYSCYEDRRYICKTKKIFSKTKFKKEQDQGISFSTNSSGVPIFTAIGIVFCGILLGLFVGVVLYHYKDKWMICFT